MLCCQKFITMTTNVKNILNRDKIGGFLMSKSMEKIRSECYVVK